jgi:hypothetical protein
MPDSLKEDLNTYEIFLLLVAAWLHDWGMIGEAGEDPLAIRESHHKRTEDYFEKLHEKIDLNLHEALIAGRISKGHRKENLFSAEYDDMIIGQGIRIRTRLLSAVLRMADEMDVTHSRTPEVIYYTINPSGKSKEEFEKHLSITGIGQLDVPHKVYLTGIARDPMGAKAIRELTSKIQTELNTVKSILSENGIQLDTVELRLDIRGFVDKPIGFEIDRAKIVDLLIGQHLYGKPDVAIRELVQNAVDSCNVRRKNETGYVPGIYIEKKDNTIKVEDNGMGMSFIDANRFLSCVGSSFYKSEDFLETIKDKPYDPISNYGIGLLSSFLIADGLIIETKKAGEDACLFTISTLEHEWKYEKGSLINPGTRVVLLLNEIGKGINLEKSLCSYFICLDVPITYCEGDANIKTLSNTWSADEVVSRFLKEKDHINRESIKIVTEIFSIEYDVILVYTNKYFHDEIVLFNHGIFVNRFDEDLIDNHYCFFVNVKKNLIDLHISRDTIIKNSKWYGLMHEIYNVIFGKLLESDSDKSMEISILQIASMIEDRFIFNNLSANDLFNRHPFLHSFFKLAPFPLFVNGKLEYCSAAQIVNNEEVTIYQCASENYQREVMLFKDNLPSTNIVFKPYRLPSVEIKDGYFVDLMQYLVELKGKSYQKKDLRTLLLSIAKQDENDYSSIAPPNVRFATFENFKPLVVVLEPPVVTEHSPGMGSAYWGNILLFWELLDADRIDSIKQNLRYPERFDCIELVSLPIVLLDSSDDFIRIILNMEQKIAASHKQLIIKYFKFLAFLPLVINQIYSCLIFIEVVNSLEEQIASILSIERPDNFLSRLKPDSRLYMEYFEKYGINYIEA